MNAIGNSSQVHHMKSLSQIIQKNMTRSDSRFLLIYEIVNPYN